MAEQYAATATAALVAATAKTAIELATTATIDNVIIGFDISFDGVTSTAIPVRVEMVLFTATGTGTALTPNRIGQNQGRGCLTTAKINNTVEGTTPVVQAAWLVPPTSGMSYLFPLGRELAMTSSRFLGLRLTAPAVVNYACNLWFEE